MMHSLSRRRFLTSAGAAGFALATPACATAPETSLRPAVRADDLRLKALGTPAQVIAASGLTGEVAYAVMNARTGQLLEHHDGTQGMPPASCAKALTASYALSTLGADFRYDTRVIATGPVSGGTVQGDLLLLGSGDPTLGTDDLAALVADLKGRGVTGVNGRFLVCGTALPYERTIDAGQPDHVGYSPAVSGLNLNYNRVHFGWSRGGNGYDVTMDGRSDRLRPAVSMAHMTVASRSSPVYTYRDAGGRDEWTVASGALGGRGSRWLPVRKPDLYAGEVFRAVAAGQGISLPQPVMVARAPGGTTLASWQSQPLRILLRDMLKWSNNLTAECVGMTATLRRLGSVRSMKQSGQAMSAWVREEFGGARVDLLDHSGLGPDSRIAPADMARALYQLNAQVGIKSLMKPFPMRDSQRRILENHPIDVNAKTGTLNFVSGLSGFADLPEGGELVFAIFTADMPRRNALSRDERERPEGGAVWNRRAKTLQQTLIERWGRLATA
ncbi:D-alanyl-D-alanine carboxypeptidase [Salipiger pallidus]|uniref:D-alanyl-D-alanine carboxypeptidase n=1 Tax=Salipiger pallidus TaxID=1775170 RepID=A0A8J2ZJ88_9RHOB|nr:D-alanyl-D-alanine carboxypeptidase/D-alanyl-D-alanine-endopeptidase [Salipiger pallidus]GGG71340.1 D-alanyl-D-alanine carboxypeptidase [Salipiger pallidus]